MKLYHRTTREAARSILRDGFRNGRGRYLTDREWEGVWLAYPAPDETAGARGPVLLAVRIPVAVIRPYEWVEEGKGYREFLVPTDLVNRYGPVTVEALDPVAELSCASCGWRRTVPTGFIAWQREQHRLTCPGDVTAQNLLDDDVLAPAFRSKG
ncbi:MAG TPA: hypothetical protein VMS64_19200 [Candidatus Methylomirabilis sp.]|nr:hypothetical protein [Candidatus Methylomirabilis sp.]